MVDVIDHLQKAFLLSLVRLLNSRLQRTLGGEARYQSPLIRDQFPKETPRMPRRREKRVKDEEPFGGKYKATDRRASPPAISLTLGSII